MPRIVKPWDIIGHLCEADAAETGFPAGIPICAGAGDTMESMMGSGILEAGRAVDVAGTCAVFLRGYGSDHSGIVGSGHGPGL